MAWRKPALLGEKHVLDGFDCGEPSLDEWLIDRARSNQDRDFTRTFVIADENWTVLGYHSLCAGMIHRNDAPRSAKGGQAPADIPVALLARLAVDRRGTGLGAALLRHALLASVAAARNVAFRAVMVDAIDARAADFYRKYGFEPSRISATKLLLPMNRILASLEA